jgi:hypothetical protein
MDIPQVIMICTDVINAVTKVRSFSTQVIATVPLVRGVITRVMKFRTLVTGRRTLIFFHWNQKMGMKYILFEKTLQTES